MKRVTMLAILAGALWLAACGTPPPVPPAPKTADQVLYETKAGLDIAILQADAYAKLPRCGGAGVGAVCSSQPIAARLYQLAATANGALDAGKVAVATFKAISKPTAFDAATVQTAADGAAAALQQLIGALSLLKKG